MSEFWKPYPPFCIQVELAEGCNLQCSFCGIQGIREKAGGPYKFLDLEVAKWVAYRIAEAGWAPRIEFAMHGEPTWHPDYIGVVRVFRGYLPKSQLMMTTNGGGLLRPPGATANINALLDAGLNILALDDYKHVRLVPKVRESYQGPHTILDYPADRSGNPHVRRPVSAKIITVVKDITDATTGTHSVLNNHAGCAFPKNDSAFGKPCAKPFRELSVRWDGNVAVCCNDWRGEYKCGNIVQTPLQELWANKFFDAARRRLVRGLRDFGPCAGCDALSYRPGLLPDPKGKETMPEPDAASQAAVREALAEGSYTAPVWRPWEETGA